MAKILDTTAYLDTVCNLLRSERILTEHIRRSRPYISRIRGLFKKP